MSKIFKCLCSDCHSTNIFKIKDGESYIHKSIQEGYETRVSDDGNAYKFLCRECKEKRRVANEENQEKDVE